MTIHSQTSTVAPFQGGPIVSTTRNIRNKHIELDQTIPRWRHQMGTFSALLALCAGNSPVTGEFPSQRPVTQSFDVFILLCLNKRLSKQSWGWWFQTLSRSLWHHSVETPSAVDPQWNILHWGSKWNLHTVCWGAIGCELGTTFVSLGFIMFASPSRDFLSLLWSPSINIDDIYFCQKYYLKHTHKILKNRVGSKFEWGL